jgi:hypothetical protein
MLGLCVVALALDSRAGHVLTFWTCNKKLAAAASFPFSFPFVTLSNVSIH